MNSGRLTFLLGIVAFTFALSVHAQRINRKAVVGRHNVINSSCDTLSSLTVGNGKFAFTVDATGLQSFPDEYANGVPLGTQSEWGWHAFPNLAKFEHSETLESFGTNGRTVTYSIQQQAPDRRKHASEYFRQNPHRLQLGNVGFEFSTRNDSQVLISDIKNVRQQLNLWEGEVNSAFTVDEIPVNVTTVAHPDQDAISIKVSSQLLRHGKMQIRLRFPYPTGGWSDKGVNWTHSEKQTSEITNSATNSAIIARTLDTTSYYVSLKWTGLATISKKGAHYFLLTPTGADQFEVTVRFDLRSNPQGIPPFNETRKKGRDAWASFWKSGGAIDFGESTHPKAAELERRMILSQYLLRVQEAGTNPPQETGLTYNSWYGKPHMEMFYWHAMHYALWSRTELLERSMGWYFRNFSIARKIADRQGYDGVRWQKMTDNDGREIPSSVGAYLIWQQPHFIYLAELCYRNNKDVKTLQRYKDIVFATADFMASFPAYDSARKRYVLNGVIPAQERFKPEQTFNPTYELAYWRWGLQTAQQWRQRLNLARNDRWEEVLTKLSPLPVKDGRYLFAESAPDSYTNSELRTDHPAVLGAYGMMPRSDQLDLAIMQNTFDWIWTNWNWDTAWGWDFPMIAMTATRLHDPEKALTALLMNTRTNTFLRNGHNYQDKRLTIYLPGNGALLAALAMMVAGFEGYESQTPGIPNASGWKLKWESIGKMP